MTMPLPGLRRPAPAARPPGFRDCVRPARGPAARSSSAPGPQCHGPLSSESSPGRRLANENSRIPRGCSDAIDSDKQHTRRPRGPSGFLSESLAGSCLPGRPYWQSFKLLPGSCHRDRDTGPRRRRLRQRRGCSTRHEPSAMRGPGWRFGGRRPRLPSAVTGGGFL